LTGVRGAPTKTLAVRCDVECWHGVQGGVSVTVGCADLTNNADMDWVS
jgi:hypothetical protein